MKLLDNMKRHIEKSRWKSRLKNVFYVGGIYRLQELEDGKKIRHLPKVKKVFINEDKQTVRFYVELRLGINPTLIKENTWLIEQRLGKIKFLDIKQHKFLTIEIHM